VTCTGNDNLHWITSRGRHRLRVDLEDWGGKKAYAEYDDFKIGSEKTNYKLISLGHYTGTAGQ